MQSADDQIDGAKLSPFGAKNKNKNKKLHLHLHVMNSTS